MKKDLLELTDINKEEILEILNLADDIKRNPISYSTKLKGKTLLMIFEKPSLRTRVSFEVGMTQMGGHAIYYDIATSPMGKKESISDTAKTASRYIDIIMARLFSHEHIEELAKHSTVPVINALTNFSHPCQILGDLQTIREKKGKLEGLKLAYLGDGNNNVTHSLLSGCAISGIDISVGCPDEENFRPFKNVIAKSQELAKISGSKVLVTPDIKEAAKDADIIYTDSWMPYHISDNLKEERLKVLQPYQVNQKIMGYAKSNAVFMHCLPSIRGMEQTADVIDGPQSIVFDQAENRLHVQKALMIKMLEGKCTY